MSIQSVSLSPTRRELGAIHINRRTREVMKVSVGIDPGWDQNVGLVGLDREGLS